jgi:Flp pilus assembly protein TadG
MNTGWRKLIAGAQAAINALIGNTRGSTLAMCAAAVIPLLLIVGSGLDMSRAYMAKLRLQQACDAGSLAGRRVMQNDTLNSTVTTEANKFFNFNFPQGAFQTATFTPSITKPATGVIRITASTTIPTSIMKIFGYSTLPLSVDCKAEQHFINTDVMLVLDNTGSMNCTPGSSSTCSSSSEQTGSKMDGMRDAVLALYDQLASVQTQLEAAGMRLRYGIVPYSSVVNVGKDIYGLNSAYINTTGNYWQRGSCASTNRYGQCTSYNYTQTSVPHNATWMNSSWTGCIEERATDSSIQDGDSLTIPSGAHDLLIDEMPTSTATRWNVWDSSATSTDFDWPNCNSSQRIKRLQAWTRTNLQTYLNNLSANGGTMSDIGVIWGGRLLSANGIFSADNPNTYNGMGVNRFLIVMTDGAITAYSNYYGAYGIENKDHRILGPSYPCSANGAECTTDSHVHRQRFSMACNAIKAQNVSIWVIGFGQSFTGSATSDDTNALSGCASNSAQVAYITDSATLISKFTQIGQTIGALRLSQ